MRKILLKLLPVLICNVMFAQTKTELIQRPTNSININCLGDASLISLHYDKQFFLSNRFFLSGKIGVGYNQEYIIFSTGNQFSTFPHHVTANIGSRYHFVEGGIGATYIYGNSGQYYIPYSIIGYRFQMLKKKNVLFRAFGQIPFKGYQKIENVLFIPIGCSIGFLL